jgi:hypothetical protein
LDISSSAGGYSMTHSGALTVASLYNYGTLNTGSVSLGAGKYVVWNNDAGLARDSVGTIGVENASYGAGYYDGLKAATLSLQQLASPPGSPTIGQAGTAGSTSYSYRVVAYMGDGSATTAGGTGSTSTGNATLSSSSYNTVTFTQVTGASSYGIYRTAAGGTGNSGTTGLVGTIAYNGFIFHDTGAAGDGTSPPVYNSTGVASVYGLSIASTQTTISGSSSGSAIFSEPDLGPSEKKAIIYCNALTGTASYTFPVAFTNTPVVVTTSGPAASVVTSLSTTAVTVTGSGTTGPILVEGY